MFFALLGAGLGYNYSITLNSAIKVVSILLALAFLVIWSVQYVPLLYSSETVSVHPNGAAEGPSRHDLVGSG